MPTPTITCPTCEGRGTTELPAHLASTLEVVQRAHKPLTAEEVLPRVGDNVTVNAINNRLLDLFLLGLITRERDGKFQRYSATVSFSTHAKNRVSKKP